MRQTKNSMSQGVTTPQNNHQTKQHSLTQESDLIYLPKTQHSPSGTNIKTQKPKYYSFVRPISASSRGAATVEAKQMELNLPADTKQL